jgi:DNA-directed RNA polymerase specialized sigma24 family protein
MVATSSSTDHLSRFNHLVLQCQEDAYTLAWYLLGDEAKAAATTQAAVSAAYPLFLANSRDCKLLILKRVIQLCQGQKAAQETLRLSRAQPAGRSLNEPERQALVLIEIVNLSYQDTAVVTGRPVCEISGLLGQARRKIAHG